MTTNSDIWGLDNVTQKIDENYFKKPSTYIDYSEIEINQFEVKLDKENKRLSFIYKENRAFKFIVNYSSTNITNISLPDKYSIYFKDKDKYNICDKLNQFCYNEIHKYITVRRQRYFYKDLEFDVTNTYRSFTLNQFKYQILQLRGKTKSFKFYWKHICKKWDNEFLKNNLWSRQIIIDFLCRFNKLNKLGKSKRWILDETEYFYLKGFTFKKTKKYKAINNLFTGRRDRLGCKNKTKELVKFFNGEECVIKFYSIAPLHFNSKTILQVNDVYTFINHFIISFSGDSEHSFKIMKYNMKQVYQTVIKIKSVPTDIGFVKLIRFVYKHINDERIEYPKYLKKKIKFECQKILINNF